MSTRALSDVSEAASHVAWIGTIGPDQRGELLAGARVQVLARGEALPAALMTPPAYAFVTQGVVKVARRHLSGRDTILHIVDTGGALLDGDLNAPVQFVALLDDTHVLLLRGADVLRVVEATPATAWALLAEERRVYLEMRELAGDLTITPLPRRIAWILVRLAKRFGLEQPDGGRLVPLPLSRQDIADLSGTTLETAIRVMSRLQREGVIRSGRAGLDIRRLDQIERIAAGQERLRARVR
jgi:CRP/FNR family transcriptional regulator